MSVTWSHTSAIICKQVDKEVCVVRLECFQRYAHGGAEWEKRAQPWPRTISKNWECCIEDFGKRWVRNMMPFMRGYERSSRLTSVNKNFSWGYAKKSMHWDKLWRQKRTISTRMRQFRVETLEVWSPRQLPVSSGKRSVRILPSFFKVSWIFKKCGTQSSNIRAHPQALGRDFASGIFPTNVLRLNAADKVCLAQVYQGISKLHTCL